jgi:hypothetical protein
LEGKSSRLSSSQEKEAAAAAATAATGYDHAERLGQIRWVAIGAGITALLVNRQIGRDPDPFIRDQMLREYNSGRPD